MPKKKEEKKFLCEVIADVCIGSDDKQQAKKGDMIILRDSVCNGIEEKDKQGKIIKLEKGLIEKNIVKLADPNPMSFKTKEDELETKSKLMEANKKKKEKAAKPAAKEEKKPAENQSKK